MLNMKLAFLIHQLAIVKSGGSRWQRGMSLAMGLLGAIAAPAHATPLENWQFDPATNQLEVTVKDGVQPRYLLMAKPARLVLELPNTEVGRVKQQQTYTGAVRKIDVSPAPAGKTRIVLELAPGTVLGREQAKLQKIGDADARRDRWILQPVLAQSSVTPIAALPTPPQPPASSIFSPAPASSINFGATLPPADPPAIPIMVPAPATAAPVNGSQSLADYPPGLAPNPGLTVVPPTDPTPAVSVPPAGKPPVPNLPLAPTAPKAPVPQKPLLDPRAMINRKPGPQPTATASTAKPAPTSSTAPIGRSPQPIQSAPAEVPLLPPEELPPGISLTSDSPSARATAVGLPITTGGGVAASAPALPVSVKPPVPSALPDRAPTPAPKTAPAPEEASTPPPPTTPIDIVITRSPATLTPETTPETAATPLPTVTIARARSVVKAPVRVTPVPASPPAAIAKIPPARGAAKTSPMPTALLQAANSPPPILPQTADRPPAPAANSTGIPSALLQAPPPLAALPEGMNAADRPVPLSSPGPLGLSTPTPLTPTASTLPPGQIASLPLSALNPSLDIPSELPPATTPNATPGAATISVPPLNSSPLPTTPTAVPTNSAPPATSPAVTIPPLQTSGAGLTPLPAAATIVPAPATGAIEFGQPLPNTTAMPATPPPSGIAMPAAPTSVALVTNNLGSAFLPVGTVLNLQYAGPSALALSGDQPRQEVLLLKTEIRDQTGNVIVPVGTPVTGRFETGSGGSRFITQAMSLPGRSVALVAQSEALSGIRQPSQRNLLQNSGFGALAGAIVGGLSGGNVLGGAAAGAAITYVTSPKPATIQPGQMVSVRLVEDLK